MESPSSWRRFFSELKRRNVYKVAATYAVVAFVGFQAAQMLIPSTRLPGWTDEFFLFLLIIGFPVAVVVAWAFELTPEGVRRTSEAETGEVEGAGAAGSSQSRFALQALIVSGLVGAAAAGGWYLMAGEGETEPEPRAGARSIAVLPFEALGQEEPGTFADGMHDDLLTRLSNISDLKVISRTSVMRYRDTELALPAIADSLSVAWILEGGVQRIGDQIQVNAQLIDPRTDTHAWSESYRRDLTASDLFALQSEITKRIAGSLEAELTSDEEERVDRRPTENLEAYRLYVEGRTHLDRRTEEGLRRGLELFQATLARDSSYALAWSGLADARWLLGLYGHEPVDSTYPMALEAARRAVELDGNLAEAHASLGAVHQHLRDIPAAHRELERAVELRPSYAQAQMWLGEVEGALDRPERALERMRRAVELNPRSPVTHLELGWTLWWVEGPGESALRHLRQAAALEPEYALAYCDQGLVLSDAGRREEAVEAFRQGLDRAAEESFAWRWCLQGLGTTVVQGGDTARALEILDRLRDRGDAAFERALLHGALGQKDRAFQVLEDVQWAGWKLWDLRFMPAFEVLRNDARYEALLRRLHQNMGLNPDGSLAESTLGNPAE